MTESERSRRELLAGAATIAGGAALGRVAGAEAATAPGGSRPDANPDGGPSPRPRTPAEALTALKRGNRRYRKGKLTLRDYSPVGEDRANDQKPFAAIITCADSRISPTLVFDVERGNIFVSRVAGNSIDVGTLGSTEYAVAVLGVKLIMVLGHSDCGAVKSAIAVANGTAAYPPAKYGSIGEVVNALVAPIQTLPTDRRTLKRCTATNARAQADLIAASEPIVKPAVAARKLRVVAAVYDISTGKVSVI